MRLKAEAECEVRGQKIPSVPTQVEIDNHNLTHEPFKDWCEVCTMYRARQDKHVVSDHSHSGHSVLSYDFGYCSRMPGGADKLTCLVLKDRGTQLVHVVTTLQKSGKSLQYLVTEFVRFVMHTGHRELALRSDLEPSNLAILDAVHHEPVPVGSYESNGAAEATLQHIRLRAGMWVQQIENQCAGGKTIFPCNHPLFAWALLHSCWIYNRFVVTAGSTAFERSTDRMYTGKLAMFGECVLGFLKTDRKAAARWQKGIWLGKSLTNDTHIIAQGNNVFVTRSTRRLPTPFVLEGLGEVVACPWDYGYALGHCLV